MRVITLTIDGHELSGTDEETVLDVARAHGIHIPTMCQLDGLPEWGGCRLCLVEVQGSSKLQAACVSRVAEGMVVNTHSPKLLAYRQTITEMLFSEGNHVCSVCVSNGHCELQTMAQELKIDHVSLPYRYPERHVDASHKYFVFDPNRCILCTRCVRVCDDVEGAHTWDVSGRGIDSKLITDLDTPWGESQTCTNCGKCVQACPTGALFEKGTTPGEMEKSPDFLHYLQNMREQKND
ncbi:MAG TPA: bidirectional hydrogenase complex protein HoxU [Oculatellaceae cyanobacterium]